MVSCGGCFQASTLRVLKVVATSVEMLAIAVGACRANAAYQNQKRILSLANCPVRSLTLTGRVNITITPVCCVGEGDVACEEM